MEQIGFIGLGIMGKPMALNLIKAGYPVSVLESSHAAGVLTEAGAKAFSNSKELAKEVDVVITMLPDSPEVEEVVSGQNGVLEGIQSGTLFIDMSTISPSVAVKVHGLMQEKDVEALDAPVSGGQVGAENAALSIMVGGSEEAFNRALPIFQAMGKNIVRMGEPGTGQTTKACNQMIVGMTIQAVGEAFTLASKAGVDLARMREALLGGFAQSRILDLHGQRLIDRNFQPGFKIKLHKKDMGIALDAGKEHDVDLKGTALVADQMKAAIEQGYGEKDHSALVLLLEDKA
ncbi:NAD(P)-dependent oxidoreductase [Persicitalea jodogahamensis]|uniref:2-hydroxy-3-oxopropionate reductase n=1 Tax=Persicitalea jodogahamensis TaxID=402147 RepID=A0A8J3GBP4_9BACT|nr:NAD(P)-dependent oxidoreductase [Persicitalea jodogahamensis]GHB88229.1 2-hydroxy-3-oxopropionate reductase [Persicitalea jodogahamensis]